MFAISVFLFVGLGLISLRIEQLIIFVIVVFCHEAGHFLAMKTFGYSNVKMFFLPFFGAMTSGDDRTPNATEEALVSLSGPVPGIFMGIASTILYAVYGKQIYYDLGIWLLFLNGFNLLPFFPLDGGRFFNAAIFSRNYMFELLFKIFAAATLLLTALLLNAYVLLLIPFILVVSLKPSYYSSKAAKLIKNGLSRERAASFEFNAENIKLIREKLDARTFAAPAAQKLNYVSSVVHDTWKRIYLAPPKSITTIFLVIIYFAVSFLGFVSLGGLLVMEETKNTKYELSSLTDKENKPINAELVYNKNKIRQKTELDPEFRYHGKREIYLPNGTLVNTGNFYRGVPDGEWMDYRTNIVLKFDKGRYAARKELKNGVWVETPSEKLSNSEKSAMENWLKKQKPYSRLRPAG